MHLLSQTTSTGHNLKWDHFEILVKGRSDTHRKIKETLLIRELKPAKSFIFIGLHLLYANFLSFCHCFCY